ncbi:hypothetical protein HX052_17245 [Myroides marinus]|uniref:Transmembrane protein n=1 Tax=Myroides marinus TaxID=703342 RepID=A0A1H6WAD0_9FLAO|nr:MULTISPECIES: DUF6660 family protein [Myroides]MDM1391682.1 hypothetical protein [Myroides marinus]MDM1519409.1 hypothetical protein [Myroides odoratimimus]SEJ13843.1 hypothetical protein SAMN04488018_11372 [Myroides marinus]
MKVLQKILSILMLTLIVAFTQYPCADRYFVNTTQVEKLITQEGNASDQSIATIDMCSPLCTCICCTIIYSTTIFTLPITTTVLFSFNKTPLYFDKKIEKIDLTIWQPPKIMS